MKSQTGVSRRTARHAPAVFWALSLCLLGSVRPAPVQAQSEVTNVRVPFSGVFFNSCAPAEPVAVEGELHLVRRVSGSGDFDEDFHHNTLRLRGVGLSSGDNYVLATVLNSVATPTERGGSVRTETFLQTFLLIRQGQKANLLGHDLVHVTFDANGQVTAELESLDLVCRG